MQVLARRVLTFLGSFYSCSQKYKKVWHFLRKTLDICLRFGYNNTRRQGHGPRRREYADVAELADALDSGSSSLKRVWVQIPSSAPKSSNVCSGIFCFSDLFGMTSIVPRTVGADSYPPAEPCHYCKRPGSLASIDPCGAVGVMPYATAKCTRYKYTYPAHKNIFLQFFPALHRPKVTVFDGATDVLLLQSARDAL